MAMIRTRLAAVGLACGMAVVLSIAALGCASDTDEQSDGSTSTPQSGPATTSPQSTVPQAGSPQSGSDGEASSPTTFGGITTTTVFEARVAECDPAALALGSLATINPVFSTVDSYGCDATHAWAWMSPGDSDPDRLLSVLFVDSGGLWRALDTVAVCSSGAQAAIAAEILTNGCAYL